VRPTSTDSNGGKAQGGYQQPFYAKTHLLGADASDGDMDVAHRRVANVPNPSAHQKDRLVRADPRHQYTGGPREELVANSAQMPRVNDDLRGAPETIGKSALGVDAAEIQRVLKLQNTSKAARPDTYDKKADVSWSGQALQKGETHGVVEAKGTLSFDAKGKGFGDVVAALPGHQEDWSPFFFPQMYTKEDADALLNMVGENGAFLLRPDKDLGNTKFTLSVRIKGKVSVCSLAGVCVL
jgi:hypothetical protein